MKRYVIVLSLIVLAGTADAQYGGHIGLFPDAPYYTDCNLQEQVGQVNPVYVVHTLAVEALLSEFRVDLHWGALVIGVNYGANLDIGDIFTGVAVAYGGCRPLPHLIATINFLPTRATEPCIALTVVPSPNAASGEIEAVDCGDAVQFATGGALCLNWPDCCLIGAQASLTACTPVAAEEGTWGTIKALYR